MNVFGIKQTTPQGIIFMRAILQHTKNIFTVWTEKLKSQWGSGI